MPRLNRKRPYPPKKTQFMGIIYQGRRRWIDPSHVARCSKCTILMLKAVCKKLGQNKARIAVLQPINILAIPAWLVKEAGEVLNEGCIDTMAIARFRTKMNTMPRKDITRIISTQMVLSTILKCLPLIHILMAVINGRGIPFVKSLRVLQPLTTAGCLILSDPIVAEDFQDSEAEGGIFADNLAFYHHSDYLRMWSKTHKRKFQ